MTRATAKCARFVERGKRCCRRFCEHGPDGLCPDGGGKFLSHSSKTSASNSFTAAEVKLLGAILDGLVRRADLSVLVRQPAMQSLARKTTKMKRVLAERSGL